MGAVAVREIGIAFAGGAFVAAAGAKRFLFILLRK